MKKIISLILILGLCSFIQFAKAQSEESVWEKLTKVSKKTDKFNLFLNMNGSGDYIDDGIDNTPASRFYMRQLRLEAKGHITDRIFYRWRQRLNRGNIGNGNIDNLPTSIDIAGIGLQLNDKWSIFAGKQCTVYGGIEFDVNPIEVYEYSDMIEYMSNFLTGINLSYQINDHHQLQFQVLDARNGSLEETYGPNIKETDLPMLFTLNWNGNMGDVFKTRWSASIMNQSDDEKMYYFALGNQFLFGKFNSFLDFMYSKEGLDRKGIITNIVGKKDYNSHVAMDAEYLSIIMKLGYRINSRWNGFIKGMYETASISDNDNAKNIETGKYRTSYGYYAGIEYYPMEDNNLHFFLTYVGRSYDYTNKAMMANMMKDTNRVSIGFIWQLPMF